MSNPLAGYYSGGGSKAPTSPQNPLSLYINQQASQATDDTGFLSYLGNVANNWQKVEAVHDKIKMGRITGLFGGGYNPDPNTEEGKIAAAIQSHSTFNDWVNGFKQMWDNTSTVAKEAIAHPENVAGNVWEALKNPGNLAKGLLQPVVDIQELASGVSITGNDPEQLDPTEKATRVRDLVAFGAASAVGGVASGVFDKTVGKEVIAGSIAARIAKGGVVGASAGGTYSAVNQGDIESIAASAILGGGIGGVLGAMFGKGESARSKMAAPDIAKVRELTPETNSLASQVSVIDAALSHDDVANVILTGKVKFQSNVPWKLPGLDISRLPDYEKNVPEGLNSALHIDGEGKGKLLVYDKTQVGAIDEVFYRRTGYMRGEQVTYNNQYHWSVQNVVGDEVELKNYGDGNTIKVHNNDVVENVQSNISLNNQVKQSLYKEWKASIPDPVGYDKAGLETPTHILDRIPEIEGLGLEQHLDGFLKSKSFADNQLRTLRGQVQGLLADEARARLSPEDAQLVNENKHVHEPNKDMDFDAFQKYAKGMGYDVVDGKMNVSVRANGQEIFNGPIKRATKFINESGASTLPELDQNPQTVVGSGNGSGGVPPDGGVPSYSGDDEGFHKAFGKDELAKSNWGESFFKTFPTLENTPWATKYRDFFINVDRKFDTNLHALFAKAHELKNKATFATEGDVKELKGIQKDLAGKPESFRRILGYIKTSTPAEHDASLIEKQYGKTLANSGVNIADAIKAQAEIDKIEKQFAPESAQHPIGARRDFVLNKLQGKPELQQAYLNAVKEVQTKYNFDHVGLQVIKTIQDIQSLPNENISLGKTLKYADALINGDKSKIEYSTANGMTSGERVAASKLMTQMDRLRTKLGIKSNIYDVLDHANKYYDGNVYKAIADFATDDEVKNLKSIASSGALNAYDDNPFKIQLRMIKGYHDINTGFFDHVDPIKEEKFRLKNSDFVNALNKIREQNTASAKKAESVFLRAIADIKGVPGVNESATRYDLEKTLGKFGMKDGRVLENMAYGLGRYFNFKYLDGRPQLGIGHFTTSYGIGAIGRSVGYMNDVIKTGFAAVRDEDTITRLKQKGVFRSIAPYSAFTPDADINALGSRVGHAVDVVEDKLFKATLLPSVYDGMVSGHYLVTERDVLSNAKLLSDGKITANQFVKNLYLTRYDVPVIKQFRSLIESGKVDDAAHYLAMNAVEDLVGTFGKGNTPQGWGSAVGSLAGQYGQYSRFKWAAIARLVTRGTIGERMQSAAKLGAVHVAMNGLSNASGINFMKLDPLYDMFWLKSVAVSEAEDIITAMTGNGLEQKLAQGRMKHQGFDLFTPIPNVMKDAIHGLSDISEGNIGTGTSELLGFRKQPAKR